MNTKHLPVTCAAVFETELQLLIYSTLVLVSIRDVRPRGLASVSRPNSTGLGLGLGLGLLGLGLGLGLDYLASASS